DRDDVARGALDALDVVSIVRATVREGCVAETISAAQAAIARDACADPALRALLAGVAEDEARHAALAWRFVRWAIGRDESLRAVVEAELARPLELPEAAPEADAGLLRAFGVMPDDELNATAREIHARVVTPCGRALLAVPEDQPAA
ncbi:MAG TPA: ferritin-like domain-containing protein, partial [Myxococcota bacterium]|nr:ferritin-like domain-containing protein [Myxococcota bacterium]